MRLRRPECYVTCNHGAVQPLCNYGCNYSATVDVTSDWSAVLLHHPQEAEVKGGSEQSLRPEGYVLGPRTGVIEGELRSNDLRMRIGGKEG